MTKLSGPGSASWAWAHDGVYSWSLSPGMDSQVLAASVASGGASVLLAASLSSPSQTSSASCFPSCPLSSVCPAARSGVGEALKNNT